MDTLAALALSTTPPFTSIMRQGAARSNDDQITNAVWRQVWAMSLWNVVIMAIVIFGGKSIYGLEYDRVHDVLSQWEADEEMICDYND